MKESVGLYVHSLHQMGNQLIVDSVDAVVRFPRSGFVADGIPGWQRLGRAGLDRRFLPPTNSMQWQIIS